ncbi:PREDICTED: four-domain proteases inhibitor-like [Nicrophorus vespilloides]|uniref:Four-domain proteases inhibitor-like n=1 Tax=Nicrophorus vespilloides TaxID=110193 RepID=A0ABM1MWC3_NICVS|nr:PREDICTED: four-domain proteases inhibitor-like [Nicrophorus vespilloides]
MKTIAVLLSVVAVVVALPPCPCFLAYKPVCGSNGLIYGNECELKCEQRTDSALTLAYHGECRKVCPCTKEFYPVCGTDAVTYNNHCLLRCASENDASVLLMHEGACEKDQKPESTG